MTSASDLTGELVSRLGNPQLRGVLTVNWGADDTVSASYAGEELPPHSILQLGLSGLTALVQQLSQAPSDDQAQTPDIKVVED